jgi:hypothetical protein
MALVLIRPLLGKIDVKALELDALLSQAFAQSRQILQQDRAGFRRFGFDVGDQSLVHQSHFHAQRPKFRRAQTQADFGSQLAR